MIKRMLALIGINLNKSDEKAEALRQDILQIKTETMVKVEKLNRKLADKTITLDILRATHSRFTRI